MKIKITAGDTVIEAMLNSTASAQELANKLPLELKMHPHQNREFYADIVLPANGPLQNGYIAGDIAYWVPGKTLVIFYGEGYTGNLIILGQIFSGLNKLTKMSGSQVFRIEKADE